METTSAKIRANKEKSKPFDRYQSKITKKYEGKTERELLERQTDSLEKIAKKAGAIQSMIAVWWWIVGLVSVIYLLYLILPKS